MAASNTSGAEGIAAGDEQNVGYPTVVFDLARLHTAKLRLEKDDAKLLAAKAALLREADTLLGDFILSVMTKKATPPSGDKHDYMSFGPYWWPDPAKANGLPYIRRDGEVNPEAVGPNSDRVAMEKMALAVETLALAHYFSGDARYAERALRWLRGWFLDDATKMNPHLKYGQAIPGITEGRGIGLIETRRLMQAVNAIELLTETGALPDADRAKLLAWFSAYLDWMLESQHGKDEKKEANNHGTWYDVQAAHFALFVGRPALTREIVAGSARKRIEEQIEADGTQPHELKRTRSFTYSILNLSGFYALADLGGRVGIDLWNAAEPDENRLRAALLFLGKYADPANRWEHRQITKFDPMVLMPLLQQAKSVYASDNLQSWIDKLLPEASSSHRALLLWPSE